jgi:hypothetical protein
MGTLRSRHNKGRKPFYKEHRDRTRTDWKRDPRLPGIYTPREAWDAYLGHLATMSTLSASKLPGMPSRAAFAKKRQHDASFDARAAAALSGRSLQANSGRPRITSQQWQTFEAGIKRLPIFQALALPDAPSEAAVYKRRAADPDFRAMMDSAPNGRLGIPKNYPLFRKSPFSARGEIAYPYIVKARPEHADILEVNNLIPKTFVGDRRADMCQEILLALLEGRTSMDQLRTRRSDAQFFIKQFWRNNFELAGHAISLDAQVGDQTYYEVASSIAAKEWHFGQINDRRAAFDALATFQPPTQIEDTFNKQVWRKWIAMQEGALVSGDMRDMLSFEEVAALMDERIAV